MRKCNYHRDGSRVPLRNGSVFSCDITLPACACTHADRPPRACSLIYLQQAGLPVRVRTQTGVDRCNAQADVARSKYPRNPELCLGIYFLALMKNLFVNFLKLFFRGALSRFQKRVVESVILLSIIFIPFSIGAQDYDFDDIQLLKDSLYLQFDLSVLSLETSEILWSTVMNKITIPGRTVTVVLDGADSKLDLQFTVYPAEDDTRILVAQSETWIGKDYNRTLTTFPLQYSDEVYYYPLGRADDLAAVDSIEVVVKMKVMPYLKTMSNDFLEELESSLDSSARFDLSGKQ